MYARIAGLHFGPVAQLGERCLRMAEVTSSSLVGSTPVIPIGKPDTPRIGKGRSGTLALTTPTTTPTRREWRLSEGFSHRAAGLVPHRRQVMAVGIEGHGDRRVA